MAARLRSGRASRVKGTGSYGAGLARHLRTHDVSLVEVDRPDRRTRRRRGKSDPIDAEAAARAALSGGATGVPKTGTGPVESIRVLRLGRRSAVKARTQTANQLHALVVAAPEPLRGRLRALPLHALVVTAAKLQPGPDLTDPVNAVKTALRSLAPATGNSTLRPGSTVDLGGWGVPVGRSWRRLLF